MYEIVRVSTSEWERWAILDPSLLRIFPPTFKHRLSARIWAESPGSSPVDNLRALNIEHAVILRFQGTVPSPEEVERAGLSNGKPFGFDVSNLPYMQSKGTIRADEACSHGIHGPNCPECRVPDPTELAPISESA